VKERDIEYGGLYRWKVVRLSEQQLVRQL